MFRELGRRDTRLVFFSTGLGVGRGWKALETDWPTFLKKSPTGSAFTHGPLTKNSATTGIEIQREPIKFLVLMALNVNAEFSATIGTDVKQKIALSGDFCVLIKMNNAAASTVAGRTATRQIFRNNHLQGC